MLRESKGNMYGWVTHTYNPIKGKCPHDCSYCYMKKFPQKTVRLDLKEFKVNLGKGNTIFVGSSCDIFANDIPREWALKVLKYCARFDNIYVFQTKNLERLWELQHNIPKNSIIGTTIETNRSYPKIMRKSPNVYERAIYIKFLKILDKKTNKNFKTMITIEPILDFDLPEFIDLIKRSNPSWINIGADSKGHNMPEPDKEKVMKLITELNKFTKIKKKNNLDRLISLKGEKNE